jgi:hypothetical protein
VNEYDKVALPGNENMKESLGIYYLDHLGWGKHIDAKNERTRVSFYHHKLYLTASN